MVARIIAFSGLLLAVCAAPHKPSLRKASAPKLVEKHKSVAKAHTEPKPATPKPHPKAATPKAQPKAAAPKPAAKPVAPKPQPKPAAPKLAQAHPATKAGTVAAVEKQPAAKPAAPKAAPVAPLAANKAPGSVATAVTVVGRASTAPIPVIVPVAADAGPDGFPVLPKVSQMLLAAKTEVQTFSSEASALEAKVEKAEQSSEQKIERQKNLFEQKLKTQEETNLKVVAANKEVSDAIESSKKDTETLEKHSRALKANNHVMHMELSFMKKQLGLALSFIDSSLAIGDGKKAKSLIQTSSKEHDGHRDGQPWKQLLDSDYYYEAGGEQEVRPEYEDEADDLAKYGHVKDDEESDEPTAINDYYGEYPTGESLLEVSSVATPKKDTLKITDGPLGKLHITLANKGEAAAKDEKKAQAKDEKKTEAKDEKKAEAKDEKKAEAKKEAKPQEESDPDQLLNDLEKDVKKLKAEEQQSETEVKTRFVKDFKVGSQRHTALLTQHKQLLETQKQLQDHQAELKSSQDQLFGVRKQLQDRLGRLGGFLSGLAAVNKASVSEVPKMLKALPKQV